MSDNRAVAFAWIRNVFNSFINVNDKESDGVETKHIPTILKHIGINVDQNDELVDRMIAQANNNRIPLETFFHTIEEMIEMMNKINVSQETFKTIDFDKDTLISWIDIRNTMRSLGISVSNDEIRALMEKAANTNDLGQNWQSYKIHFKQFTNLFS